MIIDKKFDIIDQNKPSDMIMIVDNLVISAFIYDKIFQENNYRKEHR